MAKKKNFFQKNALAIVAVLVIVGIVFVAMVGSETLAQYSKARTAPKLVGFMGPLEANALNPSDYISFSGFKVVLVNVGHTSAIVSVNGVQSTIQEGSTKNVGGLSIRVVSIFYSDTFSERNARLQINTIT